MNSKKNIIIAALIIGVVTVLCIIFKNEFMAGFREGYQSPSANPANNFAALNSNPSVSNPQSNSMPRDSGKTNMNLPVYSGQVFSIKKPPAWQVSETRNGIDVFDPNMREMLGVGSAVMMGVPGESSPTQFADWGLQQIGVQVQRVLREKELPPITAPQGMQWQRVEKEYIGFKNGQTLHLLVSAALCNSWGQFGATSTVMFSPENMWAQWGAVLYEIGESVQCINPGQVGGVQEISSNLPRNNPLDSSAILSSGQYKNQADDRMSQNWQEGMLGYERGRSETTGQTYDMPLNNYDPTVGGYRNPDNPQEILNTENDATN